MDFRHTVLLVDDDAVFVEALAAVLARDFEIMTAADGEQAMAVIVDTPPDLIVLDVMMTYASEGYDLAAVLKKNEDLKHIPIVILTGVDKMFEVRSRLEKTWVQCEAFLTKPPDFKKLVETIQSLVGSGRS